MRSEQPRPAQFGAAESGDMNQTGGWDMAAIEAAHKAARRSEKAERPYIGNEDRPNIRRIKPEESRAFESDQEVTRAFHEVKANINTGRLRIDIQSIFKITQAEKAFKSHDLKAAYVFVQEIPDLPATTKGQLLGTLARHGENIAAVYKNEGQKKHSSVEPASKRGDEFARSDEPTVTLDVSALRAQVAAPPKPPTGVRGWLRSVLGLKET